ISVFDLSGMPGSVLKPLIGVLLRIIFDALSWARDLSEGGRTRPLLVVLEEAHLYLREHEGSIASSMVQRIAKEGRKYGFGVMIVSQRPSEVDGTILSQCGSLIAMRVANEVDRAQIRGAVSDTLESLTGMLPVLRTGEAVVFGECV